MENPDRYVAIRFVVRWRKLLPLLGAAAPLIAGFFLANATGQSAWAWGGGVLAVVIGAVLLLAVEVVDLVAETLLPR